ncbi:hypothetical protein POVWA2_051120 [Plasmodium ovale wallikeri]|uniref:Uncharacterized protein n=1 Tax=Plasmodium ovale wallikeri TaxID=864142 RepID=A0A1A8ZQ55_PLAOA|nr:hypothetical protein POVWA1_045860 [Plasmodium ovale wallikeri]SBT45994.1 hypothetical protein POVWA2_051120 [Plasmodium ovale wallikeri]
MYSPFSFEPLPIKAHFMISKAKGIYENTYPSRNNYPPPLPHTYCKRLFLKKPIRDLLLHEKKFMQTRDM